MKNTIYSALCVVAGVAVTATLTMQGCSKSNEGLSQSQQAGTSGSFYVKYGGQAGVQKIVDTTVANVLADCTQNPYFTTVLGTPGHDTEDKLKSCLDLQLTAAMGGPATYPGVSHYRNAPPEGYTCVDMTTIHEGLGIPSDVFDQFVVDTSAAFKTNGVSDADIALIAPQLLGLKPQVVASPGTEQTYDYTPENPPGNGCTVVPSSRPSASPTPSPSGSASASPSASPSP